MLFLLHVSKSWGSREGPPHIGLFFFFALCVCVVDIQILIGCFCAWRLEEDTGVLFCHSRLYFLEIQFLPDSGARPEASKSQ